MFFRVGTYMQQLQTPKVSTTGLISGLKMMLEGDQGEGTES